METEPHFKDYMIASREHILDTIRVLFESLTKTEKKIASTILSSPDLLNQCSLAEIAKHLGISEASMIRFYRTLGFKGFTDFKLQLAIELATNENMENLLVGEDITPEDQAKNIADKLRCSINNVINETIHLLDFDQLDQVIKKLLKAKRIFLFGVGTSGITASEAKHKLMRIGLSVDAPINTHFMYMQAALTQEDDVVIGISHSGYSKETIHALGIARKNGTTTVALTHNPRSPITMVSDYVLLNGHRQSQLQGDSIGTKVAQFFVLDLIYALIVQADKNNATEAKQKTINVILEQRIN